MSFNEMILTMESESSTFDKLFNQIVMFTEASYNEYKVNLKEAELKVIQESGTTEDLVYLESKAKEGFLVRSAKAIEKMINTFVEWIKKTINSFREFLNGEKTKKAFDKANTVIKENPKLKSEKIEMVDINKVEKVYKKHEAMVDKKIAMFKANKVSEKSIDELDDIEKSLDKDLDTTLKVTAAVALVSVIGMGGIILSKLEAQEREAKQIKAPEYNETDSPEKMEGMLQAYTLKMRINKEKANFFQNAMKNVFNSIKGVFTGSRQIDPEIGASAKKEKEDEVKQESTIDANSYLDNLLLEIEESAIIADENDEMDNEAIEVEESTEESNELEEYLEALEKEIETMDIHSDEVVEESVEVTAEEYLESMESELFDESVEVTAEEYLESMESELFSDEEVTAESYLEEIESELFGSEE